MSDDFHRTNLNLHRSDYEFLLARYGFGWTTQVRDLIHQRVVELQSKTQTQTTINNNIHPEQHSMFEERDGQLYWHGIHVKIVDTPPIDLDKLIREQEQ